MTLTIASSPIVVDASVAAALMSEPEDPAAEAWSAWVDASRTRLAPSQALFEIANALLRGKRLEPAEAGYRILSLLGAGLELTTRDPAALGEVLELAVRHGLTVYDAAYLWLAIDIDGELATRDRALIRAAEAESVPLALE